MTSVLRRYHVSRCSLADSCLAFEGLSQASQVVFILIYWLIVMVLLIASGLAPWLSSETCTSSNMPICMI